MMTAEIKILNPSWKPSCCSEGLSAKWRGPEIKAESWGRKNSPHLVHELVNTPYHHQSVSHRHSAKWVESFQEGPQTEVLSHSLLSPESSVEDSCTAVCRSEQLRPKLPALGNSILHWLLGEAASPPSPLLQSNSWSPFPFLSSFCLMGLGKEPESSVCLYFPQAILLFLQSYTED